MIRVILLLFAINFNVLGLSSDCNPSINLIEPRFIKDKRLFNEEFEKKHGKFKRIKNIKEYISQICTESQKIKTSKKFGSKNSYPFVYTRNCKFKGGIRSLGGKKLKHVNLGHDQEVIAGGKMSCIDNKLYISNDSRQYCFPLERLGILVKKVVKIRSEVFIKHKQAKFCALNVTRFKKYKDIISGKGLDFGYKKNHVYSAKEFLQKI